jgi:FKBP-type peptidyl-prolyl cis-trans isomerase
LFLTSLLHAAEMIIAVREKERERKRERKRETMREREKEREKKKEREREREKERSTAAATPGRILFKALNSPGRQLRRSDRLRVRFHH